MHVYEKTDTVLKTVEKKRLIQLPCVSKRERKTEGKRKRRKERKK